MLNNALKDFRDGTIDEKAFRDAVTESQHPMESFAAFFKEEIEPLREVDPDHYEKYKEVAAIINKAQSLSREAWENLEHYSKRKMTSCSQREWRLSSRPFMRWPAYIFCSISSKKRVYRITS